jgi:hypothetical protein
MTATSRILQMGPQIHARPPGSEAPLAIHVGRMRRSGCPAVFASSASSLARG